MDDVDIWQLVAELVLAQRFEFYREREYIYRTYSRRHSLMRPKKYGRTKTCTRLLKHQDTHGSRKSGLAKASRRNCFTA
jgi:hypothetical protein